METELESMQKKCKLFFDLNKMVHVTLKGTKKFYNGKIISANQDFFIVKDKKGEIPVRYEDLYKIEVYEEK